MRGRRHAALAAAAVLIAGCGDGGRRPGELADGSVPAAPHAVRVGKGPRFQPPPGARAIAAMKCLPDADAVDVVHLELFAEGRIIIVPAGIGFTAPLRRRGAYVLGGRCSYPLRTREPTGLVELTGERVRHLGDLFEIWGRALGPRRLLSFSGPVRAWVDGAAVDGDPRDITLEHHAQIVIVSGPAVPVHATYAFPPGL